MPERLTDDQLTQLNGLKGSLERYGPVLWDDWPTGETIEDWDEDDNEVEVEETTPVLGHLVPAKEGAPFDAVMLFLIDPDGEVSPEARELIAEAVNALPALLDEIDQLREAAFPTQMHIDALAAERNQACIVAAERQTEIDRLRADFEEAARVRWAAGQQIDRLRAERDELIENMRVTTRVIGSSDCPVCGLCVQRLRRAIDKAKEG